MKVPELTKMKCTKCNYEWHTSSKKRYVTCPDCQQKVRNFDVPVLLINPKSIGGSYKAKNGKKYWKEVKKKVRRA